MTQGYEPKLDRVPPQDIDAERAVLGAMMLGDEHSQAAIATCIRILNREDCFYRASHLLIFDAIKALFSEGEPIDLLTVTDLLVKTGDLEKVGGVPTLNEMIDSCPSSAHTEYYANMIKDCANKRRIIRASAQSYNLAFDDTESAEDLLNTHLAILLDVKYDVDTKPKSTKQVLKEVFKEMQKRAENPDSITGIPFGIPEIDNKIGGLLGGDLCIIAARPGLGKSTWVQNVAQHLCEEYKVVSGEGDTLKERKANVAIFSLEMKDKQIVARLLASEASVPFSRFRSSHFAENEWPKLAEAASRIDRWSIHIEDKPGMMPSELRSALIRLRADAGPFDLVIVDYLQLMTPDNASPRSTRENDVAEISRMLKKIAMEFDVPFLVVSQLNRNLEGRTDKRPQLSDLRESGAIEQDADIVCFLYREDYYDHSLSPGPCEFIIAKQRMGPIGTVPMHFNMVEGRFRPAQRTSNRRTYVKND